MIKFQFFCMFCPVSWPFLGIPLAHPPLDYFIATLLPMVCIHTVVLSENIQTRVQIITNKFAVSSRVSQSSLVINKFISLGMALIIRIELE